MRRASKSIVANFAEGFGKSSASKLEFRRYLSMSIGSADEMRVWCRYAYDLNYIDQEAWQHWSDEFKQIAKMLQALASSLAKSQE